MLELVDRPVPEWLGYTVDSTSPSSQEVEQLQGLEGKLFGDGMFVEDYTGHYSQLARPTRCAGVTPRRLRPVRRYLSGGRRRTCSA